MKKQKEGRKEGRKEKDKEERERRESVGKVLTRQEMFRIFDKHWVLLEHVHWPNDWRQRTGIIHAYDKDRGAAYKKVQGVGKRVFVEYFDSKPATCAFA